MKRKIIVILPVHNRVQITKKFIKCLIEQTYENWDLILVDDGCKDGTTEMARNFVNDVKVLRGDGYLWWAGSLQLGYKYLKNATEYSDNDIVLIINDDVIMEKDYLLTANKIFDENVSRDILVSSNLYNNETNEFVAHGVNYDFKRITFARTSNLSKINLLPTRGLFLSILTFLRSGGFYPTILPHYFSDYEFTYRLIRKNAKPVTDSRLFITFFPDEGGFNGPSEDLSIVQYIKSTFSYKNKSNPIHFIIFVFLTSSFPHNIINSAKIFGQTVNDILKVFYKKIIKPFFPNICPVCNSALLQFNDLGEDSAAVKKYDIIGAGKRSARCKKCKSSDRERLVFLYLRDVLNIFDTKQDLKILHFAPEKNISEMLRKNINIEYIKGDWFDEGYKYDKTVKKINVCDIPYGKNYFDIIICNHVLEHVMDDSKAMAELFRVLKPSGKAILQVPISSIAKKTIEDSSIIEPEDRLEAFGQKDHVRIYGKDYVKKLEKVGFRVDVLNISNREEYKKYGLNSKENLFIGKK